VIRLDVDSSKAFISVISKVSQTWKRRLMSSPFAFDWSSSAYCFMITHKLSMGLKSGESAGQPSIMAVIAFKDPMIEQVLRRTSRASMS
jgi:hypothetical protein